MRIDSLELLRCPACHGRLTAAGQAENGLLEAGSLHSRECGRSYPIVKGIPQFVAAGDLVGLNSKYERLYNWIARFYDSESIIASQIRRGFFPEGEEKARREVVGRLRIRPGDKVLETSIGTGSNVPYLDAGQAQVFGIDLSLGMLNQCVRNLARWKLQAELFLGNAEELPFADGGFDVVFHLGAINFFTNPRQGVEEMIRVAKPGTRIVIADENEQAAESDAVSRFGWGLFFGRRTYQSMLEIRPQDILGLVPAGMLDVSLDSIWLGKGYRLEFTKP